MALMKLELAELVKNGLQNIVRKVAEDITPQI